MAIVEGVIQGGGAKAIRVLADGSVVVQGTGSKTAAQSISVVQPSDQAFRVAGASGETLASRQHILDLLVQLQLIQAVLEAPGPPAAATSVATDVFPVDDTVGPLTGAFPRGATLRNTSTGGQTVRIGNVGGDTAKFFPLEPGASTSDPAWQDLSILAAIASAAGAELSAIEGT